MQRNERIYASRLCTEAVHHLLIVDDLLRGRAPLGSSKRERLVPGSLTQVARASVEIPAMNDSDSYFSRLAEPIKTLVSQSEKDGHCSPRTAERLLAAIDQMILLVGAR